MPEKKPLMGLCPIGKFVFSNEDAIRQKQAVQEKLQAWGVPYVDLEGVLEDGLVKDQSHVDRAVEHFRQAGVDCLFMPHCNFGTEGAVGMIAKKLGVPVLLWGPRDEAPQPDGTRLRDSLCGLFASSKVLYKLGVPTMYIENCRVDDPPLEQGVDTFLRAVNVADAFRRGFRVGLIGSRIDFFWTTIVNESELLQKFNVEVQPFDMVEFIEASQDRARRGRAAYEREVRGLRAAWIVEDVSDDAFVNVLAVRDQMLALADDYGLEGMAFQTFNSVINAMGAYCVLRGEPGGREAGLCAGERHPRRDQQRAHAPRQLQPRRGLPGRVHHAAPDRRQRGADLACGRARSRCVTPTNRCASAITGSCPARFPGMLHFRLKDGPITVARFDGDFGEYRLAVGEGRTIDGPATLNNYLWMQVDDWPRWERTLIEGPYIHHCAMGYGQHADALLEACKFVPGLKPVELGQPGD